MTLYLKGTNTRISGTLERAEAIAFATGLNIDGSIAWSGAIYYRAETETVLRDGCPVWVSADGDEYATDAVEDRRDDGSVADYQPLGADEPVRPVTAQILAHWRHNVLNHQTQKGAKDWADDLTMKDWLTMHGYEVRDREPHILPEQPGALQVSRP